MPDLTIIAGCNGAGKSTYASIYQINLIFFCLANQEIARHRIQVRTEFKGHFVNNETIDLKWKAGYKNLNLHFRFFDNILIVQNGLKFMTTFYRLKKGK